jgi:hypothetical protein
MGQACEPRTRPVEAVLDGAENLWSLTGKIELRYVVKRADSGASVARKVTATIRQIGHLYQRPTSLDASPNLLVASKN